MAHNVPFNGPPYPPGVASAAGILGSVANHTLSGACVPSHSHSFEASPHPDWVSMYDNYLTPLGMIAVRLQMQRGSTFSFDFIQAHRSAEKAFVFIVQGEQSVTLEDDPELFPSDRLITQLRLLIKTGVTR